jgi:hypothetical protein
MFFNEIGKPARVSNTYGLKTTFRSMQGDLTKTPVSISVEYYHNSAWPYLNHEGYQWQRLQN